MHQNMLPLQVILTVKCEDLLGKEEAQRKGIQVCRIFFLQRHTQEINCVPEWDNYINEESLCRPYSQDSHNNTCIDRK